MHVGGVLLMNATAYRMTRYLGRGRRGWDSQLECMFVCLSFCFLFLAFTRHYPEPKHGTLLLAIP